MKSVPYERVIAMLAGPLAALVGVASVAIVHANVSHSNAVNIATMILTAGATFLAHNKWLSNLPHWWATGNTTTVSSSPGGQVSEVPTDGGLMDPGVAVGTIDPTTPGDNVDPALWAANRSEPAPVAA